MTPGLAAAHLVAHVLAATPAPTTSVVPSGVPSGGRLPAFVPNESQPNQYGAGLTAFLIVLGLIVVSIGLFIAMGRSLRTARRNLGGDVLPGPGDRHPEDDEPPRRLGSHR